MIHPLKAAILTTTAIVMLSACAVPVAPAAPAAPAAPPTATTAVTAPTATNPDAGKAPQATSTSVTINPDAPTATTAPASAPEATATIEPTVEPTVTVAETREMLISPANLDSLELQVKESKPVQVSAIVKGTLGDGCTNLNAIEQKREGNTFTIDVTVKRPKDAMCTMIAKLLNETVPLDVAGLKAGTYIVAAGTLSQTFTLAADN